MEIKEMTMTDVEARLATIKEELETAENIEELSAEADELIARKAELNAMAEERAAAIEQVVAHEETTVIKDFENERKSNEMENVITRNSKEYVDAFAEYVKTGKADECRAMLTENATNGTVAVPELVEEAIRNAWENEELMQLVKKSYIKGNLKVGFQISSTGAVVHTEGGDAPDAETLTLGIANLVPESIKKWITISDEVMDMRGESFLRYIYEELAHEIAKKAADELIADIEAAGTTSSSTVPAVAAIEADTIGLTTIAQALGELSDRAANPVIVMNKKTWPAFKAVQAAANYGQDIMEGLKVVFNNSIDSYDEASSGDTYAIVGDFGYGALVNCPNGDDITIKFDELSLAEADLVKVVGRKFCGHGVVAPFAFCKIAKTAAAE